MVEPLGDGEEFGAGAVEVGEAFFDFVEAVGDEGAYVFAGGSALFPDVEDLADLGEFESGGLGGADEGDPGDGVVGVVAVAGRGAGWFGEEALVFVEAQGVVASWPIFMESLLSLVLSCGLDPP